MDAGTVSFPNIHIAVFEVIDEYMFDPVTVTCVPPAIEPWLGKMLLMLAEGVNLKSADAEDSSTPFNETRMFTSVRLEISLLTSGLEHKTSLDETNIALEWPRSPNIHVNVSVDTKDLPIIDISVPPRTLPLDGLAYRTSISL